MATRIILDTDIGDDVDDALALALLCACPELELVGVTTVFGNVAARARQARTILATAGPLFGGIPVAAGCGASMASRPMHNIKAYLEDRLPNQDATCLPESGLPPLDRRHAVNFILDTIRMGTGDIVPITIGAMTNLALALVMDRRIAAKIPKVVVMGCDPGNSLGDWNVRCDPEAAHILFSSGIPIDAIQLSAATIRMTRQDLDRLASSDRPMARRLTAAIRAWQRDPSSSTKDGLPVMYDPMTIATMIRPDLVTWNTGTIHVELSEHNYGCTRFAPDTNGPHRLASDPKHDLAREFLMERLLTI
jgi:purine nucleosidase/pyrimidine-specific ribonucleoside hydrolase